MIGSWYISIVTPLQIEKIWCQRVGRLGFFPTICLRFVTINLFIMIAILDFLLQYFQCRFQCHASGGKYIRTRYHYCVTHTMGVFSNALYFVLVYIYFHFLYSQSPFNRFHMFNCNYLEFKTNKIVNQKSFNTSEEYWYKFVHQYKVIQLWI